MSDIASFYNASELALSAYAGLALGDMADQVEELIEVGMTPEQAQEFAVKYPDVIAKFEPEDGSENSGFSAVVFKDSLGKLTLAIRGTEGITNGPDLITDLSILNNGAGYDQIVDMYNWWRRISAEPGTLGSAEPGTLVQQFEFARGVIVPEGALSLYDDNIFNYYLIAADPAPALESGNIHAELLQAGGQLNVTGHSLGAHLALAFNALFPEVADYVYGFNTPGFVDSAVNRAFFEALGGEVPTFLNDFRVTNIFASEVDVGDAPFYGVAGLHFQSNPIGEVISIAIEDQWLTDEPDKPGSLNHSQIILTDALAVYNLLSGLDPDLTEAQFAVLFKAASHQGYQSLERIVDSVARLLGGTGSPLLAGNPNREELYVALYDLQAGSNFTNASGSVRFAEGVSAGPQARTDFGKFLSLFLLTPFTISADEAVLALLHPALYSLWSADRALTPTEHAGGKATFSDLWLQDRSAMLAKLMLKNTGDIGGLVISDYEEVVYTDLNATGTTEVRVGNFGVADSERQQVMFDTTTNLITGKLNADRLYGGPGNDVLVGDIQSDTLSGGLGDDVLYGGISNNGTAVDDNARDLLLGGVGADIYYLNAGDRMLDSDRSVAQITYNGNNVAGTFTRVSEGYYKNEPFGMDLYIVGTSAIIKQRANPGDIGFTILNFQDAPGAFNNGDFGLTLDGEVTYSIDNYIEGTGFDDQYDVPEGSGPLIGTGLNDEIHGLAGDDDILGLAGDNLLYGGDGVDTLTATTGKDTIFGGTDRDFIASHGGNDMLDGGQGSDIVNAGDDDDIVHGSSGDDLLTGNAGSDFILGGDGEDLIFGDTSYGFQARQSTYTATFSGYAASATLNGFSGSVNSVDDQSDIIDGGAGRDIIFGGGGNDWIFGGNDSDFIEGQAGADFIDGGSGDDVIDGDDDDESVSGNDTIYAGEGNDFAQGGLGNDVLYGGAGDDQLQGDNVDLPGGGDDVIYGGDGNDLLVGGDGQDKIHGESGDDILLGDGGVDSIWGGTGADRLYGGDGNDYLSGGDGNDRLEGGAGDDRLVGGAGDDLYILSTGSGEDRIFDDEGNNVVIFHGLTSSNVVLGLGSLSINAGNGDIVHIEGFDPENTSASFSNWTFSFADEVVLTYTQLISKGLSFYGTPEADVLSGTRLNDNIYGLAGNDSINGLAGNDYIDGGEGDDQILGGAGFDTLVGGDGNDYMDPGIGSALLTGGAGDDTYFINSAADEIEISDIEGANVLQFENPSIQSITDLTIFRTGSSLFVAAGGSEIRISNWSDASGFSFILANETVITYSDIGTLLADGPLIRTPIPDQSVNEDAAFSYQIDQISFAYPEEGSLDFSATLLGGAALPEWLTFDADSLVFSGTPLNEDVDVLAIELTVSAPDGTSETTSFALTVNNTNDAPVFQYPLSDRRATAGDQFQYKIPDAVLLDQDVGDTLSYSAILDDGSPLPAWLQFNASTKTFQGVPAAEHIGLYRVQLHATDSAGSVASDEFIVRVTSPDGLQDTDVISSGHHSFIGASTSSLGDINGDGLDDIYISAFTSAYNGEVPEPFESYILFGSPVGYGGGISLDNIAIGPSWSGGDPTGVVQHGLGGLVVGPLIYSSFPALSKISAAHSKPNLISLGDIDGDGIDDFALNVPNAVGTSVEGAGGGPYILYGRKTGESSLLQQVENLGGNLGFEVVSADSGPESNFALKGIGDINGDNIDDFLFGAGLNEANFPIPLSNDDGYFRNSTLVLGRSYRPATGSLDVDAPSARVFALGDGSGELGVRTLTANGDFNGDGKNDVVAIDMWANMYVVLDDVADFNAFPAYDDIAADGGPTLFSGDGIDLAEYIGDYNGDGMDDLFVIRYADENFYEADPGDDNFDSPNFRWANKAFVIFGREDAHAMGEIDLDELDGTNGFQIDIPFRSYSAGGDFDGDGLSDILILDDTSQAHVIFGRAEVVGGGVSIAGLDSEIGFSISTPAVYSATTQADLNGDGFSDIVLGSPSEDAALILYGHDFRKNATFVGSEKSDYAEISENGSRVFMMQGDDAVNVSGGRGVSVHAGSGNDEVRITGGSGVAVNAGSGNDDIYIDGGKDIKVDTGGGVNRVFLDLDSIFHGINDDERISLDAKVGKDDHIVVKRDKSPSPDYDNPFWVALFGVGGRYSGTLDMSYGYSLSDIRKGRGSLMLEFADGDLEIHIEDFDPDNVLEGPRLIETFIFSDVTLTYEELMALGFDFSGANTDDDLRGTSVHDRIYGLSGNDQLAGGRGDDQLEGGDGDDVYLVEQNSGLDIVKDISGEDAILFGKGIALNDLTFEQVDDDLHVSIADEGKITVLNWFADDINKIEVFRFSDSDEVLASTDVEGLLSAGLNIITGTSASNVLVGTDGKDRIEGLGGSDTISAGAGDDVIVGGQGRDTLKGEAGNDTFLLEGTDAEYDSVNGGDGNDLLLGGAGDDTFRFHNYSGVNTVETLDGGLGLNVIAGTSASNVIDLSGTVLAGIARIEGLDGSDALTGSAGDDVIIGGQGRDTLKGEAGNDTFLLEGTDAEYDSVNGGDGNDLLLGGGGDDTFRFHNYSGVNTVETLDGGLGLNVIAGTSASNVIDLSGTVLAGIARIEGLDGSDALTGSAGDDVIIGGQGRDTLKGEAGNDTFLLEGTDAEYDSVNGGDGNDLLLGGAGDDTFRFHNYSGVNTVETLDGGLGLNVIAGTSASNVIDLSGTVLAGIARIEGLDGSDALTGSAGDDVIIGGQGRDTLKGEAGNDTFLLEGTDAEYDSVNGGDGNDLLLGGAGDDTFRFHNYSGVNTVETLDGGLGLNVIAGTSASNVIDLSGTVLLGIARIEGLEGSDALTGSAGDDVLVGGAGQDSISGGAGNDTYLFTAGDGNDLLNNMTAAAGDIDVLIFGEEVEFGDLFFSRQGNSLRIDVIDSDDGVTIHNAFLDDNYMLDEIWVKDEMLEAASVASLVQLLAQYDPSGGNLTMEDRVEITGIIMGIFQPII